MNTYASQHPADLTPLYESAHATFVLNFKKTLLLQLNFEIFTLFQGLLQEFLAIRPKERIHCCTPSA